VFAIVKSRCLGLVPSLFQSLDRLPSARRFPFWTGFHGSPPLLKAGCWFQPRGPSKQALALCSLFFCRLDVDFEAAFPGWQSTLRCPLPIFRSHGMAATPLYRSGNFLTERNPSCPSLSWPLRRGRAEPARPETALYAFPYFWFSYLGSNSVAQSRILSFWPGKIAESGSRCVSAAFEAPGASSFARTCSHPEGDGTEVSSSCWFPVLQTFFPPFFFFFFFFLFFLCADLVPPYHSLIFFLLSDETVSVHCGRKDHVFSVAAGAVYNTKSCPPAPSSFWFLQNPRP